MGGVRVEIQATVKSPAIRNMRKAISLYFIFAMSLWIVVTYIGYWYALPCNDPAVSVS